MYAYQDANGRPLSGPCRNAGCPYLSLQGIDVCPVHASALERETFQPHPTQRVPASCPVKREPEWIRRARERRLPAKETVTR